MAGVLFFLTCCSVFFVRVVFWEAGPVDSAQLTRAWAFTAVLMGLLLAHELGHFVVARHHGFRLSLPWFLPAPILIGTLGAVIRLEESPRTRTGLLEMGAAGPLAGLVVVAGAMLVRLGVGEMGEGGTELASPLLWVMLSLLLEGQVVPINTADPVGFAAWLGCLLTAMNLLPFGQLDGGHVVAALSPRWATTISWATTGILLVAGLWWPGWAVWAAILHLMGARFPVEPRRMEPPTVRAKIVAGLAACAWLVTMMPVPL